MRSLYAKLLGLDRSRHYFPKIFSLVYLLSPFPPSEKISLVRKKPLVLKQNFKHFLHLQKSSLDDLFNSSRGLDANEQMKQVVKDEKTLEF